MKKTSAPRRLALLGVATTAAVLAGLLVAPPASAAVLDVDPGVVTNTVSSQMLTFRTEEALPPGTVQLVRDGGSGDADTLSGQFAPTSQDAKAQTSGPLNFADGGRSAQTDGPANPGRYNVRLTSGTMTSTCDACFTVAAGAPDVRTVAPGSASPGEVNVTLTGANFARGSKVEVLKADGTVDPGVTLEAPPRDETTKPPAPQREIEDGITTSTTLVRRLKVDSAAVAGPHGIRVRNTDGQVGGCTACLTITGAPLKAVSPSGESNNPDRATPTVTLAFRGSGLGSGVPSLVFIGDPGSATRDALTIQGTDARFAADKSSVTAQFDLRNAAPGRDVYRPTLTQSDNSTNICTCTFDVEQITPAAVTAVSPVSQPAASSQTVQITGSGLSRGVRIQVSGGGVTTTAVRVLSSTRAEATFAVAGDAVDGARTVTPVTTDGRTGTACTGCYTVTGGRSSTASPSASPTATTSPRPTATTSPSPSRRRASVRVSPATITSQQAATVLGTATPGSVVELRAYSRPSTVYRTVRRGVVGPSGEITFEVRPSGNTRLFLRATDSGGRDAVDSASAVLTVRTSLNLKVTRTGTRTYRFTGSTLPKRAGQTVSVRYRSGSGSVVAAKARVAADGSYAVTRRFGRAGTLTFFTTTGADIDNAAGTSNAVRTTVR